MNPSLDDEQYLLSRCFAGDGEAAEALVRRFSDLVYQSVKHTFFIKQAHFNKEDIEDLHNTVFLQLFEHKRKKLRQYEGRNGCSLASWIRVVSVRIVLNHLRKNRLDSLERQKKISLEDMPELKGEETGSLAVMEKSERDYLLQAGIKNLSPRDRLFMKLHFEQGLTEKEVASIMQVSVKNVYTVKHRAIQRLKSHIALVINDSGAEKFIRGMV